MNIKFGFDSDKNFPNFQLWISPEGKVYQCDIHQYQGHNRVACFILTGKDFLHDASVCESYQKAKSEKQTLVCDKMIYDGEYSDALSDSGWVRIHKDHETRSIIIDARRHITDAQDSELAELKQIFKNSLLSSMYRYKIVFS